MVQARSILTDEDVRRLAPSVFAEEAHASRSERYVQIPTHHVMQRLRRDGFEPVFARESRVRDEGRLGFAKHMIRFRSPERTERAVGDVSAELVLVNSHDGSSAYHLMAGLFRLVCLNGMVVDDGVVDAERVRHKGDVVEAVAEGAQRVLEGATRALSAPRDWSRIDLTDDERLAFAESAHILRFADAEGQITTPVRPHQLLQARRVEDQGWDLWTTFNIVQEHAVRGGLQGVVTGENGRRRRVTTRAVNGIDQDVRLNRALWTLADRMAKLKGAD